MLPTPTTFRELVSGRRRGPLATLLRGGLRLVEFPYSWVVARRNFRYDRGKSAVFDVQVPVISVGNLTLGGTGKTPLVEWLARHFLAQGIRTAMISRGYGAGDGEQNDEALELALALPEVPHLQNPNRVVAAQQAIDELDSQLLLLDDGFQHRRLARDVDVVLLDATEPFGFDHVFPRGTLREALAGLRRAHVAVLSRADMLDRAARQQIQERVQRLSSAIVWCEVVHQPSGLVDVDGNRQPLSLLQGKRIAAFCGIGNPAGFRHTLETLGCQLLAWQEFPDHHRFTSAEVDSLTRWASAADHVVCTRKDLVKLGVPNLGKTPLHAVQVQLEFLAGQAEFEAVLRQAQPSCDKPSCEPVEPTSC